MLFRGAIHDPLQCVVAVVPLVRFLTSALFHHIMIINTLQIRGTFRKWGETFLLTNWAQGIRRLIADRTVVRFLGLLEALIQRNMKLLGAPKLGTTSLP